MARQQKPPTRSVRWRYKTRLPESVVSTPKTSNAKCEVEVICAAAVERAYTKSLDANDKLRQTRPHVRNTIASRETAIRNAKS